jgi:hypothetical protein
MRFLTILGVAAMAMLGSASAQSNEVVGPWVTEVGGQRLTMTLHADGSADLAGARGRWQAQGGQILVAGDQGQIAGLVQNGQLIFDFNGQRYVWSRARGAEAPGPAATSLAGTWETSFNGQTLKLTLRPDGSADLLGTPGTWQAGPGGVVLRGPQGELGGTLRDGTLVFVYNGQQFVYTRTPAPSTTAAPHAPSGKPFEPERVLAGRTVTPERTQMSFTMPKDWSGGWTQVGGAPVYAMQAPGMQGKAMLGATAKVLGHERNLPMATLLRQGAMALWGQAAAGAPHLSESFTVRGHQAGRVIYRATIPHPQTGAMTETEGYLGIVIIDDWGFGFAGLYEQKAADLRAGLDTILASVDGKPPARDHAMEARIAGCWESGTGTGASTRSRGSAFTSAYLRIQPGSSYNRRGGVSVSTPDLDPGRPDRPAGSASGDFGEQGTFTIHGDLITWFPADGKGSYANLVSWKPGGLYLDGKLWIQCI